jgi:putative membrane protein (TIGR04086 family)
LGRVDADDAGTLLVLGYLSYLLAGYLAGRFAGRNGALHGGFAGLGLFVVTAMLAIAAGTDPALLTVTFSLLVAAVIGSAGGALADWRRAER